MDLIKMDSSEKLLNLKSMAEKLSQISLSFKIKLEEKKLFDEDNSLDVMDNVLDFFVNWCEEFELTVNNLSINDSISIKNSEKNLVKEMVIFYESEVNGVDKNFLVNQSESFKEILEAIGIYKEEMVF